MNILDKIIVDKKRELAFKKSLVPPVQLEQAMLFARPVFSMAAALRKSSSGIIAEHKRRSPSKSVINNDLKVWEVVKGYEHAGVCGISVLTDTPYFGGSLEDLLVARASVETPLLRKEFIVDEYQLLEAKAYGADVILLIAAVLSRTRIAELSRFAKELGLEVLLEVHNREELEKSLMPSLDMLGVNNRDLTNFEVSLETSKELAAHIPDDFVKVSESGISNTDAIRELRDYGYKGFLVGENFMKTTDPGAAASAFIKELTS
ncbi:MAG: indole-3-glycerol phosphate synthase TrpC [Flavobacteriaceae bacterium]|nr:indole-3-glycerol phosphate synthase TrpC [Flavobacteriaceae bacterium]